MKTHFTDWFNITAETLHEYGAFNISLINDLPLFIDPFLLFTSATQEYRSLHDQIIRYLKFLRDQSKEGTVDEGLLRSWYTFPEVKQLWLGFSGQGNAGSGLGIDFARALHKNLNMIFDTFGQEEITRGSHLEKVCLIQDGVGRDNISDFTANLIKEHLLTYTQKFAQKHISESRRRTVNIPNAYFDYDRCTWCCKKYDLPFLMNDYVILTPRDILTKDENWINRRDLFHRFEEIVNAVPDEQLRSKVNYYLRTQLTTKSKEKDRHRAYEKLLHINPQLIEWYIRSQEDKGDQAVAESNRKVSETEERFIRQIQKLVKQLEGETDFYKRGTDTLEECRARITFLKKEIENNGAFRILYHGDTPIQRESDLQILFRLTWYATTSDFNSEVNNGRGPVDFAISRGSKDKTIVEFKLAKNPKLRKNLNHQVKVYEAANRTAQSLIVIFYFSAEQLERVEAVLKDLGLEKDDTIYLVDCRADNKPSASNA